MNIDMNGKKINIFRVRDGHGNPIESRVGSMPYIDGKQETVTDVYLSATYHGDRDEFWIVEVIGDSERRHNLKFVEFFEFKD